MTHIGKTMQIPWETFRQLNCELTKPKDLSNFIELFNTLTPDMKKMYAQTDISLYDVKFIKANKVKKEEK